MNTVILTLLALSISGLSLVYLRASDPKLRRVYGLAGWGTKRHVNAALVVCFLPGLALILLANFSAFIMWFVALSLVGWGVAVKKPI
jgi:hypothetical protein